MTPADTFWSLPIPPITIKPSDVTTSPRWSILAGASFTGTVSQALLRKLKSNTTGEGSAAVPPIPMPL